MGWIWLSNRVEFIHALGQSLGCGLTWCVVVFLLLLLLLSSCFSSQCFLTIFRRFSAQSNRPEDIVKEAANIEIEDALHLFDKMLGAKPKPSMYSSTMLLSRVLWMNNPSHYPTILSLQQSMNLVGGISSTIISYSVLIGCCTRMNWVDLGFTIFGTMLNSGLNDSLVVVFSTLIKDLSIEEQVVAAA